MSEKKFVVLLDLNEVEDINITNNSDIDLQNTKGYLYLNTIRTNGGILEALSTVEDKYNIERKLLKAKEIKRDVEKKEIFYVVKFEYTNHNNIRVKVHPRHDINFNVKYGYNQYVDENKNKDSHYYPYIINDVSKFEEIMDYNAKNENIKVAEDSIEKFYMFTKDFKILDAFYEMTDDKAAKWAKRQTDIRIGYPNRNNHKNGWGLRLPLYRNLFVESHPFKGEYYFGSESDIEEDVMQKLIIHAGSDFGTSARSFLESTKITKEDILKYEKKVKDYEEKLQDIIEEHRDEIETMLVKKDYAKYDDDGNCYSDYFAMDCGFVNLKPLRNDIKEALEVLSSVPDHKYKEAVSSLYDNVSIGRTKWLKLDPIISAQSINVVKTQFEFLNEVLKQRDMEPIMITTRLD